MHKQIFSIFASLAVSALSCHSTLAQSVSEQVADAFCMKNGSVGIDGIETLIDTGAVGKDDAVKGMRYAMENCPMRGDPFRTEIYLKYEPEPFFLFPVEADLLAPRENPMLTYGANSFGWSELRTIIISGNKYQFHMITQRYGAFKSEQSFWDDFVYNSLKDINNYDCLGRTPLFYAARSGNVYAMQLLIDNGADIFADMPSFRQESVPPDVKQSSYTRQYTCRSAPARNAVPSIIKVLKHDNYTIPVWKMIFAQRLDRVAKNDSNDVGNDEYKLLVKILEVVNHVDSDFIIQYLTDRSMNESPSLNLENAAQRDIFEKLLVMGADINQKMPDGRTLLTMYASIGNKEIVSYLISKGAKL